MKAITTISDTISIVDAPHPEESTAVVIARKNRLGCNKLNDSEREQLMNSAMALIYGSNATRIPTNRS